MKKQEKELLSKVSQYTDGLVPPAYINSMSAGNKILINDLVARGHLEEVPREQPHGRTIHFYRVSAKGLLALAPWYLQLWNWISGDVRSIVVAAITAIVTTLITKNL